MKGYIAITSREWFQFLKGKNIQTELNFWRKNTNQFKVLEPGDPFFFLVKNEKGVKSEREILGMATYERFEVNSVDEAWEKYREGNGDFEKNSYIARMETMFKTELKESKIGCIILSNFKVFHNPVRLSTLNINFQNSIVSGKTITATEIDTIKNIGFKTYSTVVRELSEMYQIGNVKSGRIED